MQDIKSEAESNTESTTEELKLEEAFCRLDAIAGRLEDRETSLEESFDLYQKGMELLRYCGRRLDTVEKKILQINEDGTFSEFSRGIQNQS